MIGMGPNLPQHDSVCAIHHLEANDPQLPGCMVNPVGDDQIAEDLDLKDTSTGRTLLEVTLRERVLGQMLENILSRNPDAIRATEQRSRGFS